MTHLLHICESLRNYIISQFALPNEKARQVTVEIVADAEQKYGAHIATNAPFICASHVRRSPRAIAEEIAAAYTHEDVARVEAAGAGFVNLVVTQEAYQKAFDALLRNPAQMSHPKASDPTSYCVEYVSANPTGPLHFGHARGGIIGDVLSRVLQACGHVVTREFYINDTGAQIRKLGRSFKIRCQQVLGRDVRLPEDAYHGEYLYAMARESLASEDSRADIMRAMESDDEAFFADYALKQQLSTFFDVLHKYRIDFDVHFSERVLHIDGSIERVLTTLERKGLTYVSEGAVWMKTTAFGDDKDRVVKRGDGTHSYFAADIAYMQNKKERGFQKLVMILGQDHQGYQTRLRAAFEGLGYDSNDLLMSTYQFVTLKEDGVAYKMSKRAGRIVKLEDIIDYVGTDVARYFYLNRKMDAHLDFDLSAAQKRTDENPVYYIQYAYVRGHSIFEHARKYDIGYTFGPDHIQTLDEDEQRIVRKASSLPALLLDICHNQQTHLIAWYVYDMAHEFHRYYATHKAVDTKAPELSRHRLACVALMHEVIGQCLELLGLSRPQQM